MSLKLFAIVGAAVAPAAVILPNLHTMRRDIAGVHHDVADLCECMARLEGLFDGRMMGWVKAWLEMAVEEDDGRGATRRTNPARRQRKGTPQGAPISPLLSHLSMRRFILGWKALGHGQRFEADIVNYADDVVILGKESAEAMREAVEDVMESA